MADALSWCMTEFVFLGKRNCWLPFRKTGTDTIRVRVPGSADINIFCCETFLASQCINYTWSHRCMQGCKSINSTQLRPWIGWIESFVSRELSCWIGWLNIEILATISTEFNWCRSQQLSRVLAWCWCRRTYLVTLTSLPTVLPVARFPIYAYHESWYGVDLASCRIYTFPFMAASAAHLPY